MAEGRFADALDGDDLSALRARGTIRRWPPGAVMFHEGERSDRVLLVEAGRVKIATVTEGGTEVVLAVRGPGDLVGELAAVDGAPHGAAAVALDAVTCRTVTRHEFTTYLEERPRAAVALLRIVVARLREADARRAEFGELDSVARVARRLAELADEHGRPTPDGGSTIQVGLTQADLAGMTGSSREAVSRALRILRDEGVITTRRRVVVVHDVDALRRRGA